LDLEAFYLWLEAAYESLESYPGLRQEFDRYCRGALDPLSVRIYVGLHILKNAGITQEPSSKSTDIPWAESALGTTAPESKTTAVRGSAETQRKRWSDALRTEQETTALDEPLPMNGRPHWEQQASEAESRVGPWLIEKERRAIPRRHPLYEIKISDRKNPRMEGIINNIHVKGLQVAGVIVAMDEVKTFVISDKPYQVHEELEFAAQCRWSMINELGDCVAGFQITSISKQGASELEKLLDRLTVLGP